MAPVHLETGITYPIEAHCVLTSISPDLKSSLLSDCKKLTLAYLVYEVVGFDLNSRLGLIRLFTRYVDESDWCASAGHKKHKPKPRDKIHQSILIMHLIRAKSKPTTLTYHNFFNRATIFNGLFFSVYHPTLIVIASKAKQSSPTMESLLLPLPIILEKKISTTLIIY